jgi:antitoxin FitA
VLLNWDGGDADYLRNVLTPQASSAGLGRRIHARLSALGGVDLDVPARTVMPCAASVAVSKK